jgi:ligand-binding SRPBCC domain-containing protein
MVLAGSEIRRTPLKTYRLEKELWLPRARGEVFDFFSDAYNLNAITPPWLHFEIRTPRPIVMQVGTRLQYRLRLHGLRLHWLTEITAWEPPHRFIDRQLEGPYRQWVHEHLFTERDGGTLMRDRVDYAVPGGLLGPVLHRFFVGPDVVRIFAYREAKLIEQFLVPKRA